MHGKINPNSISKVLVQVIPQTSPHIAVNGCTPHSRQQWSGPGTARSLLNGRKTKEKVTITSWDSSLSFSVGINIQHSTPSGAVSSGLDHISPEVLLTNHETASGGGR